MVKKWFGSPETTECDICTHIHHTTTLVKDGEFFVDGKTKQGPWALMCPECFESHGIGRLGQGLGQKYDGKTFEKLEG